MGFETDVRAAAISTAEAHASAASVSINTYRARPRSIKAPHFFVDRLTETIVYVGHMMQRTVQAECVMVWGLFDSGDAVDQRDAFTDGYIDYIRDNVHAAGASTTLGVVSIEDDPTFIPDWLPQGERIPYFATRITLEGYAGD